MVAATLHCLGDRVLTEPMRTTTLHRCLAAAPCAVSAVGILLASTATATAQERAPRWRPVPRLSSPEPLPAQLPRGAGVGRGASFALLRRDQQPFVLWTSDRVTNQAEFERDPDAAVDSIVPGKDAPHSLQVGDFDGDGEDDVVGRWTVGIRQLVVGDVPKHVARSQPVHLEGPWFAGRAADWDGDGSAEIAFFAGSTVMLHHKVFDDGPTTQLLDLGPDNLHPDATAAGTTGDWDLDGLVDLVFALPQRGLVWCRNEGTRAAPRFSAPIPLWPNTPGTVVTSLVLFPVDDDPWPDLVVSTAMQGHDDGFGFVGRMPRPRSPVEEQQLQAAEAELHAFRRVRQPVDGLERLGLKKEENPFDRLLGQKRLDERITRLRWIDVPMVAQAPYVQLRTKPR